MFPFKAKAILRWSTPDLAFEEGDQLTVVGPATDDPDGAYDGEDANGSKGSFPKEFVVPLDDGAVADEPASAADGEAGPPPADTAPPAAAAAPIAIPAGSPASTGSIPVNSVPDVLSPVAAVAALPTPAPAEEDDVAPAAEPKEVKPEAAAPPTAHAAPDEEEEEKLPAPTTATPAPVDNPSPAARPLAASSSPGAVKVGGMSASDARDSIKAGGSLKDRMAMFQQKSAAPAPPPAVPRGKPSGGSWAWKNKVAGGAEGTSPDAEDKPEAVSPGPSAPAPPTASPARNPAFSAADAQSSIKSGGSLKERMAALQGQMGGGGASSSGAPPPPPSVAGKPRVWKRPEAPPAPAAGEAPPKREMKWKVEEGPREERPVVHAGDEVAAAAAAPASPAGEEAPKAAGNESADKEAPAVPAPAEGEADESTPVAAPEEAEAPEEEDEAAAEKARRAAIAARMAKLGGRGMFAPPVIAPKPAAQRQASTEPSKPALTADDTPTPAPAATQPEAEKPSEPEAAPPAAADSAAEEPSAAPAPPTMLAMPKRAAPPRRKQPTPKASSSEAPKPAAAPTTDAPIPSAPNPDEIPIPKTAEQLEEERRLEAAGQGAHGAEGAEAAGIAVSRVSEGEQAVDSPLVESAPPADDGVDVPESEAAQAELSQPPSTTVPVMPQEATLVADPETLSIDEDAVSTHSVADDDDSGPQHPAHRLSIPLPERESSHHEDTAEFRKSISTPSELGPGAPFALDTPVPATVAPTERPSPELSPLAASDQADTPFLKDGGLVSLPPIDATVPPAAMDADDEAEDRDKASDAEPEQQDAPADDESEPEEAAPPPPPPRTTLPPPPPPAVARSDSSDDAEDDEPAPPPPPPRALPTPPPAVSASGPEPPTRESSSSEIEEEGGVTEEEGQDEDVAGEEDVAPPPPPPRMSLPPPPPPTVSTPDVSEPGTDAEEAADAEAGDTDTDVGDRTTPLPQARPPLPAVSSPEPDAEPAPAPPAPAKRNSLMPSIPAPRIRTPADEETKPFFQPESRETPAVPQEAATSPAADTVEPEPTEEDAEAARRQTIAARMAKLGGIRAFGGPPIPQPKRSVSSEPTDAPPQSPVEAAPAPTDDADAEEDDETRRARARAKMAALGARGFGMFGAPAPSAPASAPPADEKPETATDDAAEEEAEANDEPTELEGESAVSDDVEPQTAEDDDTPPPPPPPRKPSTLPPPPPAVEAAAPADEPDEPLSEEPRAYTPGDDDEDDAPPPPPRPTRGAPPPAINTNVTSAAAPVASPTSAGTPTSPAQRRLSTKRLSGVFSKSRGPSIDLGRPSQDVLPSPTVDEGQPPPSDEPAVPSRSNSTRRSGGARADLHTLSKQTSSVVLRNAHSLVSQSKKAYIADGTSLGFVQEALYMSRCKPLDQGLTVFHLSGATIRERRDDIQPGDIIELTACHFKGKKGLTSYTQDVERGYGVVTDFESKKGKLHVAQAASKPNAHPTLETVSYRLEDLKAGDVVIYRAAPNSA